MLEHQDQANLDKIHEKFSPAHETQYVQTLDYQELKELTGRDSQNGRLEYLESQILFEKLSNPSVFDNSESVSKLRPEHLGNLSPQQRAELINSSDKYGAAAGENIRQLVVSSSLNSSSSTLLSIFDALTNNSFASNLILISQLENGAGQEKAAKELINAELRKAIDQLADQDIKADLLKDPSNTYHLLKVLSHLEREQNTQLLSEIHELGLINPELAKKLDRIWDNAIQNSQTLSKVDFINLVLTYKETSDLRRIAQTLESSKDLNSLCEIISMVGESKLYDLSKDIKELCAIAALYPAVQAISFPSYLEADASAEDIAACFADIENAYLEIQEVCNNNFRFNKTQVAQDLIKTAKESIADLKFDHMTIEKAAERESLSPDDISNWLKDGLKKQNTADQLSQQQIKQLTSKIFKQIKLEKNPQQRLLELANCNIKIAELETTYGINLGYGASGFLDHLLSTINLDRSVKLWNMRELEIIDFALSEIPQGHILFSPLLHDVQKVHNLGQGVLAARFHNGPIKIAEIATISREIAEHYPGMPPLAIVLTHELGHSFQIGAGYIDPDRQIPDGINLGEPRYNFEGFLELSGWESIDKTRWKLINDPFIFAGQWVELDGLDYPLDQVIEHAGKKLVLLYYNQQLLSFDPESEFASRWYAKYSPWEDFAETFSEYILVPHRLILLAPNKFKFMDEEFRKYSDNKFLQDLLNEILSKT